MAKIRDIIAYSDSILDLSIKDSSYNGLQVEGVDEVKKIALGVSSNLSLFQKAKEEKCDLIIVHHGLLWNKRWQYIRGTQKERVKFLLDNNISLAGYHLPLDVHPEIGNNIVGLKELGVSIKGKFGEYNGIKIGYWGEFKKEISLGDLSSRINKIFNSKSVVVEGLKGKTKTIGFVSGGARMYLEEAIDMHLDAYLTGETNESAPAMAIEGGINFISAGHYNTEKFGVMRLGELLSSKFKVESQFFDVPNDL